MKAAKPSGASIALGESGTDLGVHRFAHAAMATLFEVHCVHPDPRYARHESVLTVWPFDYNGDGIAAVTGLMRVDDDGDGDEDRIVTIRKAVFNYIELTAKMNRNLDALPVQTVAGIRFGGVRSPAPAADLVLLYAHDAQDTESREATAFTAQLSFYDGTLFHRIISTFVLQGGDPNTKDQPPGTWGTGGPGYSIDAEISNLKHTKYMVSMARGTDINSAGSQFFIMTGDAPFLDGKYTIFGEVIEGKDVVGKIASLQTDLNDRPVDHEAARMNSIRIS